MLGGPITPQESKPPDKTPPHFAQAGLGRPPCLGSTAPMRYLLAPARPHPGVVAAAPSGPAPHLERPAALISCLVWCGRVAGV